MAILSVTKQHYRALIHIDQSEPRPSEHKFKSSLSMHTCTISQCMYYMYNLSMYICTIFESVCVLHVQSLNAYNHVQSLSERQLARSCLLILYLFNRC